jgi:ABC-type antimicrobial peptide transport system permease subunit
VTSLLGLGLGIVALKQMAVNPQLSGRHLAIFGVCLSAFWLALLLAMGSVLWVGMSLMKDLINAIF